jgi:hypothetical protein
MSTNEKTASFENVQGPTPHKSHDVDTHIVSLQQEAQEDAIHIDLTWRSWLVVFVTCFAYVFHSALTVLF